jgi:hypothetical protein
MFVQLGDNILLPYSLLNLSISPTSPVALEEWGRRGKGRVGERTCGDMGERSLITSVYLLCFRKMKTRVMTIDWNTRREKTYDDDDKLLLYPKPHHPFSDPRSTSRVRCKYNSNAHSPSASLSPTPSILTMYRYRSTSSET